MITKRATSLIDAIWGQREIESRAPLVEHAAQDARLQPAERRAKRHDDDDNAGITAPHNRMSSAYTFNSLSMPDISDHLPACFFAAPACLRTNFTVLVMVAMSVALRPACGAAERTHFEQGTNDAGIRLRQPRQHPSGSLANVGAVLIDANATLQARDLLFG
jgi:hypothetical protein